jgi:WD40 repeat protein
MEEYSSTKHHPALLDLRGHFYLEPDLVVHDPNWPSDYPMEVFPITDNQALLVRAQSTSLIDLPSGEALWTITCPALEAALDVKRNRLALGAKGRAYFWDLQDGSLIQTFSLGDDEDIVTCLVFHPQGMFLAVALYYETIQLLSPRKSRLL